jgi:hypothetical protein
MEIITKYYLMSTKISKKMEKGSIPWNSEYKKNENREDFDAQDKRGSMVGCEMLTIDMIPDDLSPIFHVTPRPSGIHGACGCSRVFQRSNHMEAFVSTNWRRLRIGLRQDGKPNSAEKI